MITCPLCDTLYNPAARDACPHCAGEFRGFGDVVAAATAALGVKKCGKCGERQEEWNEKTPEWAKRMLRGGSEHSQGGD